MAGEGEQDHVLGDGDEDRDLENGQGQDLAGELDHEIGERGLEIEGDPNPDPGLKVVVDQESLVLDQSLREVINRNQVDTEMRKRRKIKIEAKNLLQEKKIYPVLRRVKIQMIKKQIGLLKKAPELEVEAEIKVDPCLARRADLHLTKVAVLLPERKVALLLVKRAGLHLEERVDQFLERKVDQLRERRVDHLLERKAVLFLEKRVDLLQEKKVGLHPGKKAGLFHEGRLGHHQEGKVEVLEGDLDHHVGDHVQEVGGRVGLPLEGEQGLQGRAALQEESVAEHLDGNVVEAPNGEVGPHHHHQEEELNLLHKIYSCKVDLPNINRD